jgi:hypothetical protein
MIYKAPYQNMAVKVKVQVSDEVLEAVRIVLIGNLYGQDIAKKVEERVKKHEHLTQQEMALAISPKPDDMKKAAAGVWLRWAALFVITLTGARSTEAAYIVAHHKKAATQFP